MEGEDDEYEAQQPLLSGQNRRDAQHPPQQQSSSSVLPRSATPFGMVQTNYCLICQERQPLAETLQLTNCGHRFCRDCLQGWFCYQITKNGKAYLNCIYTDDVKRLDGTAGRGDNDRVGAGNNSRCDQPIAEQDIVKLVASDPETLKKYRKFKLNMDDPDTRQCPKCDHSQRGDPAKPWPMACQQCQHEYCFSHGDQHPGISCTEFRSNESKSEVLIKALSKPCPRCQRRIIRNAGCNHMRCSQCGCSFCWLCLEEVEDVPAPAHYRWDSLSPCAGRQMEGAIERRALGYNLTGWQLRGWRRAVFLFIMFCFYIWFFGVICPLAVLLTVTFSLLGICCMVRWVQPVDEPRAWRNAFVHCFQGWAYISCLMFSCVCCAPLSIVACCFSVCGLNPQREARDVDRPWQTREEAIRQAEAERERQDEATRAQAAAKARGEASTETKDVAIDVAS